MATVTPCAPEPWDDAAREGAIARLTWVLDMTIRLETAATPEGVRRTLRELAAGSVEPNRFLLRRARARLRTLGVRQDSTRRGADP